MADTKQQQLAAVLLAALNSDFSPTWYSGRFMYGKECLGIVVKGPAGLVEFVAEAITAACEAGYDAGAIARALADVTSDSMGRDFVYYWRGIKRETYEVLLADVEDLFDADRECEG